MQAVYICKMQRDVKIIALTLGETPVELQVSGSIGASLLFINLHQNEQTSVNATRNILNDRNEQFIEVHSRGERLISFIKDGKHYHFDPNRVFTKKGLERTLKDYNETYNETVVKAVETFSNHLLDLLLSSKTRWIIAVHNTSGDYSIVDYLEKGEYRKDAKDLFVNAERHPADFFFTSSEDAFLKIKQAGYNVVLQDNRQVNDDGSLSVFCGKEGLNYVNSEALHGHLAEQTEMLGFLLNNLE